MYKLSSPAKDKKWELFYNNITIMSHLYYYLRGFSCLGPSIFLLKKKKNAPTSLCFFFFFERYIPMFK